MADLLSSSGRSRNMSAIRSKGMRPEVTVRKLVHSMGFRYRLHRSDLPGKPDLVFGSRRQIIFVHGCFWHSHASVHCVDARIPKTNTGYWSAKLGGNVERDAKQLHLLRQAGWRVLVIWECETHDATRLEKLLRAFLGSAP